MKFPVVLCVFSIFLAAVPVCEPSMGQEVQLNIPETDDGLPGVGPIRRYPWFQELWTRKRTAWAQRVQQDQGALVFLGDSITQGWGDDFQGAFADVAKTANRGISGDTTRGMLIRLQQDVIAVKPKGVVILAGTNDLEEQADPTQVAANLESIVAELAKYDATMPIIVCEVSPSSESKKRPFEKISQVNALIRKAFYDSSQVTVLDTWTLFANENNDAKSEEFPDLLHPNALGYMKWAAALRPVLATERFLETQPAPFELEAGFASLFNGRDLTGWCLLPTTQAQREQRSRWKQRDANAPPWPVVESRVELTGKEATDDGRYQAINQRLVVTTPSQGRRIQQLWTDREFNEDFTLRLEFRATPNADSGVFLRGKQLQCRDYPLAGPYKELTQYRQGGWNKLEVVVRGTTARCTCNGEVLEEAFEIPATGPIGLEGDRGQIEYRRIRIGR